MKKIKPFKIGLHLNTPRRVGENVYTLSKSSKGGQSFVLAVQSSACQSQDNKQQSDASA